MGGAVATRPPDNLCAAPPRGPPRNHPRAPPRPPRGDTPTPLPTDRRQCSQVAVVGGRTLHRAAPPARGARPPPPPPTQIRSGAASGGLGPNLAPMAPRRRGAARAARGRTRRGIKLGSAARAMPRATGGRARGGGRAAAIPLPARWQHGRGGPARRAWGDGRERYSRSATSRPRSGTLWSCLTTTLARWPRRPSPARAHARGLRGVMLIATELERCTPQVEVFVRGITYTWDSLFPAI